ncbi:carboxypeptidase-like regulatory domain-containing protein [Maribacter sp. CXY002]|uniref:carboxypeptidase-like regulatory domain-containing protein n=1 Tax=Maribacter luteocoastalis TaxID=3407671 RepID=UPI003B67D526
MKKLIFTILTFVSAFSFSQSTGTISGKVLDAELFNEPLLMASVELKNTERSTITNFNGNFEITAIAPGSYKILITFLGYEPIEKEVEIVADENTYIQESLSAKSLTSIEIGVALYTNSDKDIR